MKERKSASNKQKIKGRKEIRAIQLRHLRERRGEKRRIKREKIEK